MTLAAYLATKPAGGPLVLLIVAVTLFAVAAAASFYWKAFWATIVCAGLSCFALAFLVS
jgi:hypothetical protein